MNMIILGPTVKSWGGYMAEWLILLTSDNKPQYHWCRFLPLYPHVSMFPDA